MEQDAHHDQTVREAADVLGTWIADHPNDAAAGGVRILPDHKTIAVYWKGSAPAALQTLAASLAVPVTFKVAAYSRAELLAAAQAFASANLDTIGAVGRAPDFSGLSVLISAKAPPGTFTQLKAKSGIPLILRGTGDPTPLDARAPQSGRTASTNGCPVPARCGDSAPFYGGGLVRIRGVGDCSTGVSLYAGPHNYMTTAWHCSANGAGTFTGFDSGNVIGTVASPDHIKNYRDFMLIETSSNTGRIWTGNWETTSSLRVSGMARPSVNGEGGHTVACSCGASGNGHYQYVAIDGDFWPIRGRLVGPGFYAEEYPDRNDPDHPATGWVQPGDSGSPIVRGSSYYELQGFLSAGGIGTSPYCAPGRHPLFNGDPDIPGCWTEYWATYADTAIGSIAGLHLKTS
ncbi:hypothetical protein ACIA58_31745 [Kribbella sp. NPDC051586]|uniref:hypothetical protein n=1 Tax=Kribbella sp. NPDC051586 TaxID=3364118 RepID=UPI0037BBAF53